MTHDANARHENTLGLSTMKLFCLGSNPAAPSALQLQWRDTYVILDCGLELQSISQFLPQVPGPRSNALKDQIPIKVVGPNQFLNHRLRFGIPKFDGIDSANVDAVLITNSINMLGLPFLTEYTNFRGKIFATEPTLQTGRQLMEELIAYATESVVGGAAENIFSSLPSHFASSITNPNLLRDIYTLRDLENCLSKVQAVSFSETVKCRELRFTALSSGFSLGAAFWRIETDYEKVFFLSECSVSPNTSQTSVTPQQTTAAPSSSSSANIVTMRYPEPFDVKSLSRGDLLIMNRIAKEPSYPLEHSLELLVKTIVAHLKDGGNIILPLYPHGLSFELLELLHQQLPQHGQAHAMMYAVSPVAETALSYANICGEWLSKTKQDKIFIPESPFVHADMQKAGYLHHFPSIHAMAASGYQNGCVVFTGHPSMRCGDAVSFMRVWSGEQKNAIIFTDPDTNVQATMAPFYPFLMKVYHFPIEHRMTFSEANALLRDCKPKHVLVPQNASADQRDARTSILNLIGTYDVSSIAIGQELKIAMQKRFERAQLTAKLAMDLTAPTSGSTSNANSKDLMAVDGTPSVSNSGAVLVPISTLVNRWDHNIELQPAQATGMGTLFTHKPRHIYGIPRLDAVLSALDARDIGNVQVQRDPSSQPHTYTIEIPSLRAKLRLSPHSSAIEAADEAGRLILRDVIVSAAK